MLTFKNITIKDLKNHIFIENFNYSLGNQDKVGIIGEEGNGKSTFLKAIYDKTWIEDYMVIFHFEQLNKQSKCRATIYQGKYQDYIEQRSLKQGKEIQLAYKEKQEYMKKKVKMNDMMNAVHDALNDTVRNPGVAASLKRKMSNIKAQEKRFEKESYRKVDSLEESIHFFFEDIKAYESKCILDLQMEYLSIEDRILIKDINLYVKGRDKLVFIGDNGCGKSLLMKEIFQQLKNRKDIKLGYMPQNYADLMNLSYTPIEFLMGNGDKEDITRCRDLLGAMKFTSEEMQHSIKHLSEGQKAKLYLLKFIKEKCNVLLLDEPTRNLSPLSSPVVIQVLKEYEGCIISVSHDRVYIDAVCDTKCLIENQLLRMQKD